MDEEKKVVHTPEEVTETPVEEVAEAPAEEVTESPAGEAPAEEVTEAPVGEAPAEEVAEAPVGEAPVERRCPNCHALLTDSQAFCPECGTSLKKTCPNCGAELQDGQVFCSGCGQNVGAIGFAPATASIADFNQNIADTVVKNKNKKNLMFILGGIVIALAIIIYFIVQSVRVSEYKQTASEFCSTVLSAAVTLEDIGNQVQSEWHDYIWDDWSIYDSIDEAVAGALIIMSDEIDEAELVKISIDSMYNKLKKPVNDSDEMDEICDAVKDLYSEYSEMYDCVTNPSGSYNSFSADFGDCDDRTVDAYEELKQICDSF